MMETKILWYDATVTQPVKNGRYLVATSGGYQTTVEYANGYWNAFIDSDGVLQNENALDNVAWWAVLPELPHGKE